MKVLLSAAGRAFIRAFAASLIVYGPGLLSAPSLSAMYLLGVAAITAAFVGGIRAIQAYLPKLTAQAHLGSPYGDWLDAFLQGFVASLIVTLPGISNAPDLSTTKSLVVAALIGALTAGMRAIQGTLTVGEHLTPETGVKDPPNG